MTPGVSFSNFGDGVQASAPSRVELARAEAEAAPFLFRDIPQEIMDRVEKEERAGRWTGERLAARKPELYATIVRMLAAELPVISIAQLAGVSENTVRGIREKEPGSIEDNKKRMIGKMIVARERLIDCIIEKAPSMEGDRAAVAFGIISDKLALDQGAPTQRIEFTTSRSADEYREWMKTVTGVVIEPGVTGFEGDGSLQTRDPGSSAPPLPGAPLAPALAAVPGAPAEASGESESLSLPTHSDGPTVDATAQEAGTAGEEAGSRGGEGGADFWGGGPEEDSLGAPKFRAKGRSEAAPQTTSPPQPHQPPKHEPRL